MTYFVKLQFHIFVTDKDECLSRITNDCQHRCINTVGGYNCSCHPGYKLVKLTSCMDVDECILGNHNCSVNATCKNNQGSFSCICNKGYTGDGYKCTGKIPTDVTG